MRNMSFMLTTEQMLDRSKTVTRRLGWWNIMPGELVQAVQQCQGLKKGETITKLCVIRIHESRREPLDRITAQDLRLEGFPKMTRNEFIDLFCRANKCKPDVTVNRIEFDYV